MSKEVLIIDDNADLRYMVCNIFKEKIIMSRSAANFDQAIFEIEKLPDVAIIDIKLDKGDKDGITLLKTIMKKDKKVPVIMISGHATTELAVEAMKIGAYEFIDKPFNSKNFKLCKTSFRNIFFKKRER